MITMSTPVVERNDHPSPGKKPLFKKGTRKVAYNDGTYEGDVFDVEGENRKHGHGTMKSTDGSTYVGNWKYDVREGHGLCRYAAGAVYNGEWKDNQWNGQGTITYPDGTYLRGQWKDCVFQGGSGRIHLGDNGNSGATVQYDGDLDTHREPDGQGTMMYENGRCLKGVWKGKLDAQNVKSFECVSSIQYSQLRLPRLSRVSNAEIKGSSNALDQQPMVLFFLGDESLRNSRCTIQCTRVSQFNQILKNYADEQDIPLSSLRLAFKGKTLFWSSIGKKRPVDLGIKSGDRMFVSCILPPLSREKDTSKDKSAPRFGNNAKGKSKQNLNKTKHTQNRNKSKTSVEPKPQTLNEEERNRVKHSLLLTTVFEQAEPKFKFIRQQLINLSLKCQLPKDKLSQPSKSDIASAPVFPRKEGSKAGTPIYWVFVGDECNLYKSSNKRPAMKSTGGTANSLDLHGMTRAEALSNLDKSLTGWVDTAMKGVYPFVIPVCIICGGGNQILSEAVEEWIKNHPRVAKAPKSWGR